MSIKDALKILTQHSVHAQNAAVQPQRQYMLPQINGGRWSAAWPPLTGRSKSGHLFRQQLLQSPSHQRQRVRIDHRVAGEGLLVSTAARRWLLSGGRIRGGSRSRSKLVGVPCRSVGAVGVRPKEKTQYRRSAALSCQARWRQYTTF